METETPYAITSLALNAGEILHAARLHWGIENGFHRCLDVAFREDASAIRLRNAAANFALLRRFALNLKGNVYPRVIQAAGVTEGALRGEPNRFLGTSNR